MRRARRIAVIPLTIAVMAAAGCGSDDGNGSKKGPVAEAKQNKTSFTTQEIVDSLKLTDDPNNAGTYATGEPGDGLWDKATRCTIAVVLDTPAEVELYAGAGDQVASNPSRTAGVKFTVYEGADPSACYRVFTARLKSLT